MRIKRGFIIILIVATLFLISCQNYSRDYKDNIRDNKQYTKDYDYEQQHDNTNLDDYDKTKEQKYGNELSNYFSLGECKGKDIVLLGASPININELGYIAPLGRVFGAHVTPTDHQYWNPIVTSNDITKNPTRYNVYALADGYIVNVEHRTESIVESKGGNKPAEDDYRIVFEHSCDFYSYYDHINKLKPEILNKIEFRNDNPNHAFANPRIPVKKGEIIGTTGEHTFDLGVFNAQSMLKGFIDADNYKTEPWKIYTADPFDYFEESIKNQLLAKSIRKVKPYGGKIYYDINGKLVGNWFLEGTNGYQGSNRERYWDGHLAIAYDHIDPSQIRISIGNFDGYAGQFGVKNNMPDPANIDINTGLVKYEVVSYDYYSGNNPWSEMNFADNINAKNNDKDLKGIILVQLIEDRKLKLETFPGKKANEVSGFTDKARIYER